MTPLRPPTAQSVTTSPKENKPASATSLHVHRSKAAGPGGAAGVSPQLACRRSWPVTAAGPDARPIIARSHSAHPGGFAYLAAVPTEAAAPEVQAGWGARRARSLEGWGPQRLRPLPCRLGADRRPPARGGDCGVSSPGSRPCLRAKGSDLVSQQSLLVTATQLEAKSGGAGRERARGRWPATRAANWT